MSNEPVHMTSSSFDQTAKSNRFALIDFWADWCGPCKALAPTITELAKEYAGKVFVGKLNVDEYPDVAERFEVASIPTLVVMENGCEVDRIIGCVPKNVIIDALKKHTES